MKSVKCKGTVGDGSFLKLFLDHQRGQIEEEEAE